MTTSLNGQTTARRIESIAALVTRIKAEFTEVPGLQLTSCQAQRLWGLDQVQSDAILDVLVETAFLRRTARGSYVRNG